MIGLPFVFERQKGAQYPAYLDLVRNINKISPGAITTALSFTDPDTGEFASEHTHFIITYPPELSAVIKTRTQTGVQIILALLKGSEDYRLT